MTAGLAPSLAGRGGHKLEMQSEEVQSLRKALVKTAHHTHYLPSFFLLRKKVLSSRTVRVHLFLFFPPLNWAVATVTQEQTTHCLQWIADTHFSSTESGSELLKKVILSCCFFFSLAWYQYSFSIGSWSGSTLLSWIRKICLGREGLEISSEFRPASQSTTPLQAHLCHCLLHMPLAIPGGHGHFQPQYSAFYLYLEWPA